MVTITGTVERITYYNTENGYTVLRLKPDRESGEQVVGVNLEGLLTVVGNLPEISPGEAIQISGEYVSHPKHGLQLNASVCKQLLPTTVKGIERYLGSGLIKGIGPQLAKRIVKQFKGNTLDVIENDPQQLAQVPGIGEDRTLKITSAWKELQEVKEIMLFLHGHNVSTNLAVKIYKTYGDQSLDIVRKNPYQLEQDIYGIGFKTADQIAQNLGLPSDHPSRIEAGLVYALNESINDGHVFLPVEHLTSRAADLLEVDTGLIELAVFRLEKLGRIKREVLSLVEESGSNSVGVTLDVGENTTNQAVYLMPYFIGETGVAKQIKRLLKSGMAAELFSWVIDPEIDTGNLSADQMEALEQALNNPVSILTGGPGTGKTTCLKILIRHLEKNRIRYALASPTGRAAKRLSEATGRPASTIHRLLGYSPGKGHQYHAKRPLKAEFLIVDEASMLDLLLTYHLVQALKPGTQVLFVGDIDQLPSVGAGDVLRDFIASKKVPVSRLTTIFRQSEGSQIISNAHRINQGQTTRFSQATSGDFYLFPAETASQAGDWIIDLVSSRIPERFGLDPLHDIQVLTPIYRGEAGVDALNQSLQGKLNPTTDKKADCHVFGRVFRLGDKVMQIKNNYDKDVFNGDIGFIAGINRIDQTLTVAYDGDRSVEYDFTEADELVLAYAVSVHKSQGSEFPAVVMPVITQHYIMLQRNLLYTAITRAKQLCVLVGNHKAIHIAIHNNQVSKRYSYLADRIRK